MSTMFCKQNKTKNQLGDWMQRLEMSSCIHSITKCVSRGFIGQQFHEAWKSRMQKAHLFIFKWLTSYGTGGYCIKHVLWHCVNVNKFLRYKENCMWGPVSENSFRWTVTVTKNIFGAFFLFKSYVEFFFKYPFFGHLYTSIYQSIYQWPLIFLLSTSSFQWSPFYLHLKKIKKSPEHPNITRLFG